MKSMEEDTKVDNKDILMRINLECSNNLLNGYINVNSSPVNFDKVEENTKFFIGDYENLDLITQNDTVEELVFNKPLNILPPLKAVDIVRGWYNKLKDNGVLKINFIDVRMLGKFAHVSELSLQDLHNIIFGPSYENKMVLDIMSVKAMIKDIGFNIDIISPKDFVVTVRLVKNVKN